MTRVVRRRLGRIVASTVLAVAVLAAGIAYAVTRSSATERIAAIPQRVLDHESVALRLRASVRDAGGAVRYTDSEALLDLTSDRSYVDLPDVLRNGTLELVGRGLTLYVTVPKDLSGSFGDARWLRLDTASRAEARGAGVGPVPDPTTVMLAAAGATGDIRRLGNRKLDGQTYEVVRVTVEPRLMAERLGPDHVASANLLGAISLSWDADVWLDDDGMARRLELRTKVLQNGEPAGAVALDLRLDNFDEDIEIGIPPDDAVHPVGSVREALVLLEAA